MALFHVAIVRHFGIIPKILFNILKDYFPLLGQRKPRYHLSLYELLELNDQEIPYNQIYRYCINTLKLSIDIQKDITTGNKRCSQCLQKKNLSKILRILQFFIVRVRVNIG